MGILECRLDAVIYRMKFVPTVFGARQFVSHGHVSVNGRRVNYSVFLCKEGDVIEVKEKSREIPMVLEAVASSERDIPDYVDVDTSKLKGTFLRQPNWMRFHIQSAWNRTLLLSTIHVTKYKKSRNVFH